MLTNTQLSHVKSPSLFTEVTSEGHPHHSRERPSFKANRSAGDFLALTATQWGCVLFAHLIDKKTEIILGDQSTHLESNSY